MSKISDTVDPLYTLFSDRVLIKYENGNIIKERDISTEELNKEISIIYD